MPEYPQPIQVVIQRGGLVSLEIDTALHPRQCPNCKGIGFVYTFKKSGGPYPYPVSTVGVSSKSFREDGRLVWYSGQTEGHECPACSSGRLKQWLLTRSRLEGDDLNITLAAFAADGPFAAKRRARDFCADLLSRQDASGFVFLYGDYGVGKSHLAKALVNGFRGLGVLSTYRTMADLLADIRERFGDKGPVRAEDVIDEYRNVRVLAVDELDRVNLTGWVMETIFRLLDARHAAREEQLTILVSNTRPEAFAPEWGYLKSRIQSGVMVEVPGPDVRVSQGVKR